MTPHFLHVFGRLSRFDTIPACDRQTQTQTGRRQ